MPGAFSCDRLFVARLGDFPFASLFWQFDSALVAFSRASEFLGVRQKVTFHVHVDLGVGEVGPVALLASRSLMPEYRTRMKSDIPVSFFGETRSFHHLFGG